MKKTLVFLLCMHACVILLAQQDLGIRNSNYAGIQGALLNPSSIADSKLKWDLNIFSVDEVFDNNFLYAPKSSLHFLGFQRIIKGSIDEDLFQTHYDPTQPDKLYNVTFSTEVLGPSFFVKVAKKHSIGLTVASRVYGNVNNISGNLAQNAFAYFLAPSLWDTTFHDNSTRVNGMGWMEYGLHYATVIYSGGRNELKAGIALNYLQGYYAAYAKNVHINYSVGDTAHLLFSNSSIDYGRTDFNSIKNNGHGFGLDLGLTYVHLKEGVTYNEDQGSSMQGDPDKGNYVYRIGLSLIDAGSINFSRNAAAYHLQTAGADFSNWHQSKFANNTQLDQTLSAVFYNGDSTKSLVSNSFKMAMPSAIGLQADWDICDHFYANTTIVKGFGHGGNQGVIRPDVYSLTPRYETGKVEVSLPMSLLYYGHMRARLGVAARYKYFFVGGDAPGSLLKVNDLQGVDFYAGIHFFVPAGKTNH